MKIFIIIFLNFSILLSLGCNNNDDVQPPADDDTPSGNVTKHVVEMSGNSFSPQNLIIDVGDTVEWINSSNVVHTSTSGTDCIADGLWDSGNLSPGESFVYEFSNVGTFDNFCIPHCEQGMVGTITVED